MGGDGPSRWHLLAASPSALTKREGVHATVWRLSRREGTPAPGWCANSRAVAPRARRLGRHSRRRAPPHRVLLHRAHAGQRVRKGAPNQALECRLGPKPRSGAGRAKHTATTRHAIVVDNAARLGAGRDRFRRALSTFATISRTKGGPPMQALRCTLMMSRQRLLTEVLMVPQLCRPDGGGGRVWWGGAGGAGCLRGEAACGEV
eukprot:1892165-Prymnesium_polylepis.1